MTDKKFSSKSQNKRRLNGQPIQQVTF